MAVVAPQWVHAGRQLERHRAQLDLTAADLARASGVALSTIRRIECGEATPRPRVRRSIAKALGCDPHDLFPADEQPRSAVHAARDARSLSLRELAQRAGVALNTARLADNGTPVRPHVAARIARTLGLDFDDVPSRHEDR